MVLNTDLKVSQPFSHQFVVIIIPRNIHHDKSSEGSLTKICEDLKKS